MKLLFSALIAAIAMRLAVPHASAQDAPASSTNVSRVIVLPPGAEKTTAPAKKAAAKKAPAKPAAKPAARTAATKPEPTPEQVLHPEPGVARQNNVNVRGQASINSEVIAHLQKNEPVTILEEITLKKAKQDEPARWYRIALPTNVSVWVHSSFIDPATKSVKPRRLNLRGGPGENFSVVGRLEKGATVNQIDSKGEWLKIETPTNAFGFVAAHLLERTPAPAIVATPTPVRPGTTASPVTNPPPPVPEVPPTVPVVPAAPVTTPPVTPPPAETTTPTAPTVVTPPVEVPEAPVEKVKKVVSREGILKGSVSIQAPTYFELRSLDTGKTINYVFSPSTNLMLKQFKGQRVIVSGEELLDERWQNTPVIIVDALQSVP